MRSRQDARPTGEHGLEYVVAWANETGHGQDIVITHVDVDNLLRAKAAIYAGYTVLAERVGVPLGIGRALLDRRLVWQVHQRREGGADRPAARSAVGAIPVPGQHVCEGHVSGAARIATQRARVSEIASRMTYIELSADNTFYEAFTSALFLPHTDLAKFPTVARRII